MSYTSHTAAARAIAFQGMGMMQPAFSLAKRAMGARMITTITAAAT